MPPRKKAKKSEDIAQEEQKDVGDQSTTAEPKASTDPTADDDDGAITHVTVPFGDKEITCERQGQPDVTPALVFTHGAGGGIDSPACRDFASGFSRAAPIVSFQGSMNLKNRVKAFHTVLEHKNAEHGDSAPVLGGRSMGARAAVLTALELEEKHAALVLASYPLMAGSDGSKREPERREQILLDLPASVDVLFVIGSEDKMCDLSMLNGLREKMVARSWLCVVKGADHAMSLRPKQAVREARLKSGEVAAKWLNSREEAKRWCEISWNEEKDEIFIGEWKVEEEGEEV